MNRILFEKTETTNTFITLDDRRSTHIRKVLKLVPGDTVRIGIINGRTGVGRVHKIYDTSVTLELQFSASQPPPPKTDLILALPRPIMLKRVLSQTAALGVRHIFLINARKVEKSFFNASLLMEEQIHSYLLQGLEQSMDTSLPAVSIYRRFKPFMEDILPQKIPYNTRFIAHPETQKNLWQQAGGINEKDVALAIGPEGGWTDYEMNTFQNRGFLPFSLGSRILRVDTAVPVIFGQLNLLRTLPTEIQQL